MKLDRKLILNIAKERGAIALGQVFIFLEGHFQGMASLGYLHTSLSYCCPVQQG